MSEIKKVDTKKTGESLLPFTEEELKELNFTEEELAILEAASAYTDMASELMDADELVAKMEDCFGNLSQTDPNETFEKLGELCKTDPEFITQLVLAQEVLSEVRPDQELDD